MMLPAFVDAREFLGQNSISYSEIATLSHCEQKWDLIYNTPDREKYASSAAMELGSEMHRLLGIWWGHGAPLGWNKTEDPTAEWLMDRYDQYYMEQGAPLHMEQLEVPFAVKYLNKWVFGWWDGLVRDHETGELWIAEFKTMGNWSRLNQIPKDKQITLYIWAARRAGLDVKGVMFDAIRTYRWTGKNADSHEPAESFQRLWVERTDEDLILFEQELESVLNRRSELRFGSETPILNIGQSCDWCAVMPQCYGIELEMLDDGPWT